MARSVLMHAPAVTAFAVVLCLALFSSGSAQAADEAANSSLPNVSYAVQLLQAAKIDVHNSTIFAPDNDAFEALPVDVANVTDLLNSTLLANSTQILSLHIVPGLYYNATIPLGNTTVNTSAGVNVTIDKADDGIFVYVPGSDVTAQVLAADIPYQDNVVHILDTVLLPFPTSNDVATPAPAGDNSTSPTGQ